jgi:3-phosphoshikimate 1-carboxyvinyltransferase
MADGPTTITGIGFIRHKETDRIAAPVTELQRLGIDAVANGDGMTIHPGSPRPGTVHTYDDHRMAMSFALLGLCHPGIVIADPGCVAKTFPTYFDHLERLRRAG